MRFPQQLCCRIIYPEKCFKNRFQFPKNAFKASKPLKIKITFAMEAVNLCFQIHCNDNKNNNTKI